MVKPCALGKHFKGVQWTADCFPGNCLVGFYLFDLIFQFSHSFENNLLAFTIWCFFQLALFFSQFCFDYIDIQAGLSLFDQETSGQPQINLWLS